MLKFILYISVIANAVYANSRVVNGSDAKEGEFPYAVSLRKQNRHTCGGTILDDNHILTAAHCVCRDPTSARNLSVQYDLLTITEDPVNVVPVRRVHCARFDSEKLIFDAAVLELDRPLPQGRWRPVRISKDFAADRKRTGTIIGWGRTYHGGPLSPKLRKLDVDVYPDEVCGRKYDVEHHICFGAMAGGACNGDSGTALMVEGVQVGIASFITDLCGIANEMHPNVYSRISTYYDWIQGIL